MFLIIIISCDNCNNLTNQHRSFPANGSLTTGGGSIAEMQHEAMAASNGGGPGTGGDDKQLVDHNGKVAYANGGRMPPPLFLDKTNREIVRLIGQHLKIVGLE